MIHDSPVVGSILLTAEARFAGAQLHRHGVQSAGRVSPGRHAVGLDRELELRAQGRLEPRELLHHGRPAQHALQLRDPALPPGHRGHPGQLLGKPLPSSHACASLCAGCQQPACDPWVELSLRICTMHGLTRCACLACHQVQGRMRDDIAAFQGLRPILQAFHLYHATSDAD